MVALLIGVPAVAALGFFAGPFGLALGIVVLPLALAWRYDNQVGACFPLMLLLMIVLVVMVLLLYLMALIHRG